MTVSSSRTNRWLVLAVVSSALFLIVIDMSVLHTALPTLTRELVASASEKLWIIDAYALVVAGLLPGCGTLGDRIGHRRMFLAGLVVFGLASLVAAFAPSPVLLIAGRALLAVGAAVMMPATLSIIRLTFEDERERAGDRPVECGGVRRCCSRATGRRRAAGIFLVGLGLPGQRSRRRRRGAPGHSCLYSPQRGQE